MIPVRFGAALVDSWFWANPANGKPASNQVRLTFAKPAKQDEHPVPSRQDTFQIRYKPSASGQPRLELVYPDRLCDKPNQSDPPWYADSIPLDFQHLEALVRVRDLLGKMITPAAPDSAEYGKVRDILQALAENPDATLPQPSDESVEKAYPYLKQNLAFFKEKILGDAGQNRPHIRQAVSDTILNYPQIELDTSFGLWEPGPNEGDKTQFDFNIGEAARFLHAKVEETAHGFLGTQQTLDELSRHYRSRKPNPVARFFRGLIPGQ